MDETGGTEHPGNMSTPISNVAFFFSGALIVLIPRKVKNKRKVRTYISYVVCL